jgi:hypothetical protein
MFSLTDADFEGAILGCADGPASFNADASRQGRHIVSCDPLYRYKSSEIRNRIDAIFPQMVEQTRQNLHEFVWREFTSVDQVVRVRMAAMESFLSDYDVGREQNRYVDGELPSLPFETQSFDLALCSHFLFVYTEQLSEDFHVDAIVEMARVGCEVRVFPLLALGGVPSRHLPHVVSRLNESGFAVSIERVSYEFVRGANEMMRIRTKG